MKRLLNFIDKIEECKKNNEESFYFGDDIYYLFMPYYIGLVDGYRTQKLNCELGHNKVDEIFYKPVEKYLMNNCIIHGRLGSGWYYVSEKSLTFDNIICKIHKVEANMFLHSLTRNSFDDLDKVLYYKKKYNINTL